MRDTANGVGPETYPDETDRALRAFWRGSPDELEQLIGADVGQPGICAMLHEVIALLGSAPRSSRDADCPIREYERPD